MTTKIMFQKEYTIGNKKYEVLIRDGEKSTTKARLYCDFKISGSDETPIIHRPSWSEMTSDDEMLNLILEMENKVKKYYLSKLAAKLVEDGYIFPHEWDRITWSEKAGCSCGCSPAFIINSDKEFHGPSAYGVNIWVTISDAEILPKAEQEILTSPAAIPEG
jgi:hypothetical protein